MVSNNSQTDRAMQMQQQRSNNVRAAIAPYRKPYRQYEQLSQLLGNGNQMMYSSSQIPSDPLYIDFNAPTPPVQVTPPGVANAAGMQAKKRSGPLKGKQQKGKQQPHNMQFGGGPDNGWQQQQRFQQPIRFNGGLTGGGGGMLRNGGGGFNRPQMGGPPNRAGGRHMMPPMGPRGGHMPQYPPLPFQPPMRCPMPPVGGPPMPPHVPPPFMRRNGRGSLNHHMPPLMAPHMMGPRMPPRCMPVAAPYNMNGGGNMHMNGSLNGGKIKKPNPKLVKQAVKGKSTIKTLKNLVNQYPIDKPWVNDDIRREHGIKLDIENRLKGHKDDALFAQFKVQRDKFVAMYEKAREEYLKQEAAAVMAKDAKEKLKNANATKVAQPATIPNINPAPQQEQEQQTKADN